MWIQKLIFTLSVFSLFKCAIPHKLNVAAIEYTYIAASKTNKKGAHIRYRKRIPLIEKLDPKIWNIEQFNNKIAYNIRGHITSAGHSINRIKKIKTKKEIIDNTLYIIHYVLIKNNPGKENANIMGYNYVQTYTHKITQDIKKVKIELRHQLLAKEHTNTLMTEENINIK
ncbi:hypothetical protein [Sphingobacterium bovistauri]|uniref:Lipoprotein n=1 Tax=Sphingobacterium bovistauri TaxID=2781959 RepID=A0ABS7Z4H7_9SPHI|nr:hypothetical protein [Sphingobacterium bovistauri]MCA5005085.1 hypothetical protein [Sphingobacterium bovistauri]